MTTREPIIIALCGKGGVGKTSLSALITRMLCADSSKRVLAIDADPAVGLSYPLGVTVKKTVDHIRKDLIQRLQEGDTADKTELLRQLDYDLFSAIEEKDNLAFLAIGRPEGDGCYCQVNQLLRQLIKETAHRFDAVVIDGEAGLEQIHRRVMDMVTHLIIVTDTSLKGRNVAQTIYSVAKDAGFFKKAGVVFNMIRTDEEEQDVRFHSTLPLIGVLHDNETIRTFDRKGQSFFELPRADVFSDLDVMMDRFIA
jgi:CO dehydrogenase maturation factor